MFICKRTAHKNVINDTKRHRRERDEINQVVGAQFLGRSQRYQAERERELMCVFVCEFATNG